MNQKLERILEGKPTKLLYDIRSFNAPHTIFTNGESEKNDFIDFLQKGMKLKSVVIRVSTIRPTNDVYGLELTNGNETFYATFVTQDNSICNIGVLNDTDVIIIDLPGAISDEIFDELLESIRVELQEGYLYGAKKFVFIIDKSHSWSIVGYGDSKPLFESYYYTDLKPIECVLVRETSIEAEMTHCLQQLFDNPSLDIKEVMSNLLKKYTSTSK